MKKHIVIVGSSFAGFSIAIRLAKLLGSKHEITVIDQKPEFIFAPSLVWHPFNYRDNNDITFDTRPMYEEHGIKFVSANVYGFDFEDQLIYLNNRDVHYDYLVIATGARPSYESVKGLFPKENSWSICCDFDQVTATRNAWNEFVSDPGPLVVGAAQWASYFFAAYEFILNAIYHLDQNNLLDKVPLHFVTSEPYLCHFGIGGIENTTEACTRLFADLGVQAHLNAEIHQVKSREVVLEDGTHIPTKFTMIIPPFVGVDAVRTTPMFADEHGLIPVSKHGNHRTFKNVYAAGASVQVPQINETPIGLGVPRTQSVSEVMAKTVASNIYAELEGKKLSTLSIEEIYAACRKDIKHISSAIFGNYERADKNLDFIAKGSQEKWANQSIEKFLESTFSEDSIGH